MGRRTLTVLATVVVVAAALVAWPRVSKWRDSGFPPRPPGNTTLLSFARVEQAWRYAKGTGVTVAVLDWQFSADGEESKRYVNPTSLIPGERIGGLKPWHGAWMVETVHAVAPEASLMPIIARSLRRNYADVLPQGIRYAADHGASVVSSSMGPVRHDKAFLDAVDYALARGCIFVDVHPERTVGDDGKPRPCVPGECHDGIVHAGIVSVPAHAARPDPARDVYTWPYDLHGHYQDGWGFSNAPPTVAGVIALMLSANHALPPAQVKRLLIDTSEMKDGFRVVNAEAAVREAAKAGAEQGGR